MIIDFQPALVASTVSMERRERIANVVAVAKAAKRIVQAGARPITGIQLACELQRDWRRETTRAGFADIVFYSIRP